MELYLFDRTEKIIHFDDLTILNNENKISDSVKLSMSQNEIFVFQIALLSDCDDVLENIDISSGPEISCINTDVVDKYGNRKNQQIKLKANLIQPLFFTVKANKNSEGRQSASITINTEKKQKSFDVIFDINDSPVADNGYDDLWRLSRINWLNSDLAIDDTVVNPYVSPGITGSRAYVTGREIEFNESGLPCQIYSKFDEEIQLCEETQKELFAKQAEFLINNKPLSGGKTERQVYNNRIESVTNIENEVCFADVKSVLRYEGQLEYSVEITPKEDFISENVELCFYINNDCTNLMHGLGFRASKAENLAFKWDNDKQQDCIFIGSVNCGMRVKFKAENYIRPLINIFYKNLPLNVPAETWDNNGKGSIRVHVCDDFTRLCASTGKFKFVKNETRKFIFEIHITPFKPIDCKKAFSVRYSHNNKLKNEFKEIDRAKKNGLTHVIFHQGNMIMPFINYPFYETERLKNAVEYAKDRNIGIKLYYTEREHSNHMAETFVYKALGDEIILRKQGVSHSWQKEKPQWLIDHFGEDIIPGWFVKYKHGKYKNDHDISFIVRPDTRLDNYYIEGLNWLVEKIGIKGIYIDDTSLDRTTIERAKKILEKTDGLIDMHMWNHEEPRAGDVSCLNLYAELLPFLDSIWLGEGFFYKKYSPEYMLAEVSGIPYGVTGQMLEGGGDLYLGMLYGMNNRFGWHYKNAVKMYKIWDDFGIVNSRMLGYWHSENPVKTDNGNVLATVYLKNTAALVCIYNFADKAQSFSLEINNELLGFKLNCATEICFGKRSRKIKNVFKNYRLGKRKGIIIEFKS